MRTKVLMAVVFLVSTAVILEKKVEREYSYLQEAEYICTIKQFVPGGEISKTYYTKDKINIDSVAIIDVHGAIIDISKFPYKSCLKLDETRAPSILDFLK